MPRQSRHNKKSKPIIAICLTTGWEIHCAGIMMFARIYRLNDEKIRRALSGKRNKYANFKFRNSLP
jgi:hypothetical protein